jgi:hypothetical protein
MNGLASSNSLAPASVWAIVSHAQRWFSRLTRQGTSCAAVLADADEAGSAVNAIYYQEKRCSTQCNYS